MTNYTELHRHSRRSVLDGLGTCSEHIERSIELGYESICFTEHGSLSGVIETYTKCLQYKIKPIIGLEAYTSTNIDDFSITKAHQLLIVKNETGWQNLLKLMSESRIVSGKDGVDRVYFDLDNIFRHSEGLICTAACMAGVLQQIIYSKRLDLYDKMIDRYVEVFGDDFYLEVHAHNIPEEKRIAEVFINEKKAKCIAAMDVHYVYEKDWKAHSFLEAVRFWSSKVGIQPFSGDHCYYLHSYDEVINRYKSNNIDARPLCNNVMEIVDKAKFQLALGRSYMPEFMVDGKHLSNEDKVRILREKCYSGIETRYGKNIPQDIIDKLEYELFVISRMDYIDYFLLVSDIVETARGLDIGVGSGRGSGAGSIAAYALGITNVDPIKYGLIFSRFLNYGRSTVLFDEFGIGEEINGKPL